MRPHVTIAILIGALLVAGCPKREEPRPRPDLGGADSAPPGPPLTVNAISFAGPAGHRPDGRFGRGETVTCLFTVSGFTYRKKRAHIVADVDVRGPGGALELHQPGLVLLDGEAPTAKPGTIRSAATLNITPAAPPGEHKVELAVRDLLGRRAGSGTGSFTLVGQASPPAAGLTLRGLQAAADEKVPPGAALPLAFSVAGFKTSAARGGLRQIDLGVEATVEDAAGQRLERRSETLVKTELPFVPDSFPVEQINLLPRGLSPGPYRLALEVKDRVGGGRARALFRFQVVPPRFGVVNLHLHDASRLPRSTFLLGEQVYVRFAVVGLQASKEGELNAAVDLAVAGPGGVYLARKGAAVVSGPASRAAARAGRFPVQVPLVLPALCPTGKYRVVIRARDRLARRETVREHAFQIEGDAPKPLSDFRVDRLEVQDRPDLPPSKGDTFRAGKSYQLSLLVGGAKLLEPRKMTFRYAIRADLRLKDLRGNVVVNREGLFREARTLTYRPLRIQIPARWDLPSDLAPGLYDLEIVATDEQDDRVSQMVRRVEVVGALP